MMINDQFISTLDSYESAVRDHASGPALNNSLQLNAARARGVGSAITLALQSGPSVTLTFYVGEKVYECKQRRGEA